MNKNIKIKLTKSEIMLLELELSMAKSMKLFDEKILDSILKKIILAKHSKK